MNQQQTSFSQGLSAAASRTILRNVYIWMTLGLIITGVISLMVANNPQMVYAIASNTGLLMGLIIGQVALVWFLSASIHKLSTGVAAALFALYSGLNGVTLSFIFLLYTASSIATVFFITAGTFAAMSMYAMTTKRSLEGWGHYLMMGLIGVIIASVVNIFLRSEGMYFIISIAGVLLFTALTAYDTQQIKKMSEKLTGEVGEEDFVRLSILGALRLYLDFINLFLYLLRLLGNRR
jgi:FtsH-binding integral membrane protein